MNRLTKRQREVFELAALSWSDKAIADKLKMSPNTLQTHKAAICERLGLPAGRGAIARYASQSATTATSIAEHRDLAGHWLSRFDFDSYIPGSQEQSQRYRRSEQINLEWAEAIVDPHVTHTGHNLCGARPEGGRAYNHRFRFRMTGRVVVGTWDNSNSENVGCYQLIVHNDGRAMHGNHLGNTSDGQIKPGSWTWLRVDKVHAGATDSHRFRPYEELLEIFNDVSQSKRLLTMAELFF